MKHLGPAVIFLQLWLGAWAGARAESTPALVVELHGELPFERAELDAALVPRLGDARTVAYIILVQVQPSASGVIVRVGGRERTVPLGERAGPDAARVVALMVLDLLFSDGPDLPLPLSLSTADHPSERDPAIAAPDAPPATVPAESSLPPLRSTPLMPAPATPAPLTSALPAPVPLPPSMPLGVDTPRPPPTPATQRAHAGPALRSASRRAATRAGTAMLVRVSGSFGTVVAAGAGSLISAGADVRAGLGRWRAGAGLAWVHLPMTSYDQADIGLDGATLRLDAGRALGDVELTAAAFAMPTRLRAGLVGAQRDDHYRLLFGGGAAIRFGARITRRWRLAFTAGVDVFGRRLRLRTSDQVLMSTPLVTASASVGLTWEAMR